MSSEKISSMRDVVEFAISGKSKAAELYYKMAFWDGIRIADVLNTITLCNVLV